MNLLQHEDSPYLLQHKHNPVNWQAWSEESLKLAEELNKPILVSIGYATCHWCHVMAHESFEDQETANLMNDYFINIKIDREERPDLDNYFMNAIQAMGIQGGWPLNCFLTPGGKVFYGGTYFPPEPKYGRPSWKQVLTAIHDAYKNNPTDIEMQAENLFTHLDEVNKINALHNQTEINLAEIFDRLNANFDTANGGFGTQPKFPNTQALQLLFHLYFIKGNKKARDHAILSLQQMCMGGIYDQIDGGFCRYSVDAQWNVPHFEKMLYDHAQIMQALATGYQFNKSEYFKMIANQSFHFFEKEMLDASGLYYSAMDADSAGEEGTYYVWTNEELAQLSEENLDLIKKVYSFTALDHLHTDIKVLRINPNVRNQDNLNVIIESCATAIEKLRNIRNKRIRPDIDHKMIVAWNAMLVSAYLSWHRAIPDNSNYLDKALRLIKSIIKNCCDDANHLCRYYIHGKQKAFGFLEDYSFVIKALIEIYFYTADKSFVEKALQLFDVVDLQFKDKESELYKLSSEKYTDFKISQTDWSETIYPNANAILSWACCFFYEFTGNEKYKNISKGLIKNIIPHALNHPLAMASWVQQLLLEEGGYYILKMQDPSQINRLKNIHIPGLMIIYENLSKDQFLICFNQNCYQTAAEPAEIISLFLKHDLHPENTY